MEIFGPPVQTLIEKPGSAHFEVEGPARVHFEECLELIGGETELWHFYKTWYRLLVDYGDRHFRKPGDKLIAVSGIAEHIRKKTGFAYMASF